MWDENVLTRFSKKEGLLANSIRGLFEDAKGNIWISYYDKISIWTGEKFLHFDYYSKNFIQNNIGDIWCLSNNTLNHILLEREKLYIESFSSLDGYKAVTYPSFIKDHKDQFQIASGKGMITSSLKPDTTKPLIHIHRLDPFFDFTDWRKVKDSTLRDSQIVVGENKIPVTKVQYDSVFPFTNLPVHPNFPHTIDQLTLHWSATYSAPHKIQYSYLLEGKDQSWSPLLKENKVTYTNLSAGEYTFKVRAVNGNGRWSDTASYTFAVRPPWWQTLWAYALWVILFLSLLYGLYRFLLNRRLARAETERLRQLDEVKTRLYTNITHEFRTPLTVIQGIAGQIAKSPKEHLAEGIQMIHRNSDRLLHLVNQMLDLAKLESGSMPLYMINNDILLYLRYIIESFHSYAEGKGISLYFSPAIDAQYMDFDPEKVLDIISNLISNAIKYTDEGGNVSVYVEEAQRRSTPFLKIQVKDSGIGIAEAELPHIFDRFYQADDTHTRKGEGTGIGLALTRELVRLHNGEITVQSQLGTGSAFTVLLPITQKAPRENAMQDSLLQTKLYTGIERATFQGAKEVDTGATDKPLILIIEDNLDVIRYLMTCLAQNYQLATATNGQTGIDKAIQLIPDLIISDVMMPQKDGFEVCNTLKQDERTSHVPIILLTAKADVEAKLQGLEYGADAYLSKPFNRQELIIRIKKLIELRKTLQQRYHNFAERIPAEDQTHMKEDAYMRKAREIVEANLSDSNFGVEQLAAALYCDRSQVYRKLKALTNKSTTGFILSVRLHEARKLLLTTDRSISEIAYDVGLNPQRFSREYKKEFGHPPSGERKK